MNKTPGLDKIESYFKMQFKDVITLLHWDKKRSIKSLSDECGISRDTFQKQAKNHGLELRQIQAANKLTKNRGEKHWAFGLRKETSAWAKAHSMRMLENNPMSEPRFRDQASATMAKHFSENLHPQEIIFSDILIRLNVRFEIQCPINQYVLDFLIPDINLCIEIDSTGKWGRERKQHAAKRDKFLLKKGIRTLRINKLKLENLDSIIDILKANNVICH